MQLGRENPKYSVKAHENAKAKKMAKKAQGKQMGRGRPRENKWDTGACQ